MPKHKVIIDCDPGQDDAINLLLAFASPDEIKILGITTIAGNVPLEMTTRNACIICELASKEDVPVFAGCAAPLVRPLVTAHHVHGPTGLDGMDVFTPAKGPEDQHAVDFIIDTLSRADDASITLVPTGPLTNIALAMHKQPDILPKIREIILMGGAMREGGNYTPSAEFNIYVDPHAAQTVFTCGRPVTTISLDATHQALCTPARLERLGETGNPVSKAVTGMLGFFNRFDTEKYGTEGAPLHDACTIGYLLRPDLFQTKICNVTVEAESELTLGHTAVDFWGVTDRPKNINWVYGIDAHAFFEVLTERLLSL